VGGIRYCVISHFFTTAATTFANNQGQPISVNTESTSVVGSGVNRDNDLINRSASFYLLSLVRNGRVLKLLFISIAQFFDPAIPRLLVL